MSFLERKHVYPRYIYALHFLDLGLPAWPMYVGCTSNPVRRWKQHRANWPWPFFTIILHRLEADAQEAEVWEAAYRRAAQLAGGQVLISGKKGPRFETYIPWYGRSTTHVLWPIPPTVQHVSHAIFYTVNGIEDDDADEWSPLPRVIVTLPGIDVTNIDGLTRASKRELIKSV